MSVAIPPQTEPPRTATGRGSFARARLPRRVECVAWEPEPGRYRAICLDFSLVAESSKGMLDAQRKLEAQIHDYLREVVSEGCPAHLVKRGFSRRERVGLWIEIGKGRLGALLAGVLARPAAGDHAQWHQSVTGCL